MNDRAEPELVDALARLVTRGTLTADQASAVRTEFHAAYRAGNRPPAHRASWAAILSEVGGYVGAAFVVGAAVALVEPDWENFARSQKVLALAVPGILLLVAAVAAALGAPAPAHDREARGRLVSALVIGGGGLLTLATADGLNENSPALTWISLVALAIWGTGYVLRRGALLQVATAAAVLWTIAAPSDLDDNWPLTGLLVYLAGAAWAALAGLGWIPERATAFTVAGTLAFTGGEIVATDGGSRGVGGYLMLALLAAAGLAGYIRTRELSALAAGALSLVVVVPQAIIDYTEGRLGTAGALLVSGLSVVAVSVLVARLRGAGPSAPAQLV